MRRPLLVLSLLAATLLSAGTARAADMTPYPTAPIVAVAPPPIEPTGPAACWRYGNLGWGWYPCYAGPPPYWHYYHHGYRGRPYWARWQRWHHWYW
jgi:hypothetical protein